MTDPIKLETALGEALNETIRDFAATHDIALEVVFAALDDARYGLSPDCIVRDQPETVEQTQMRDMLERADRFYKSQGDDT